jgi:hypothetical protein
MAFVTTAKTNFETNDSMSSETYRDIGKPDIPTKISRTRVLYVAMAQVVVRKCREVKGETG